MASQLWFAVIFALGKIDPSGLPGSGGGLSGSNTSTSELGVILRIVFALVGALAVLFITISGLRYITAAGDPQRMAQAKEGIIYALVGIAIAITAEAIVGFVVGRL